MLKPQYYAKSRSDARRKDLLVVPSCVCVCVTMCSGFQLFKLLASVLCKCVNSSVLRNKLSLPCPTHSSRAVLFFAPHGTLSVEQTTRTSAELASLRTCFRGLLSGDVLLRVIRFYESTVYFWGTCCDVCAHSVSLRIPVIVPPWWLKRGR